MQTVQEGWHTYVTGIREEVTRRKCDPNIHSCMKKSKV